MIETYYVPLSTKIGSNNELIPYYCGVQKCDKGHSWGPGIRDHFLIHYIVDGKGVFKFKDKVYELKKGQGFLICPGEVYFYQADASSPWNYKWVGFHGMKASTFLRRAGLDIDNPVFTYSRDASLEECLDDMVFYNNVKSCRDIKLTGLLYNFISLLVDSSDFSSTHLKKENIKEYYFNKAVEFIHMNYSRKTSILEIAKYIGIDRKYLHFIFREYSNISPQEFLIKYRIERACDILVNSDLSIGDVSRSVGYSDPLLFSKVFKRVKGSSPSEYKRIVKL